jgi:hypothetical protein
MVSVCLYSQAFVLGFTYMENSSEQEFINSYSNWTPSTRDGSGTYRVDKLSNAIVQSIYNELRRYNLRNGDIYMGGFQERNVLITVLLRITDANNRRFQFYAWQNFF